MRNLKETGILFFAILFMLPATCLAQYTKWEKDVSFQGIEFKKLRFREDGRESLYADGILKKETIIDGYPCYKKITLTKNGHAKFFILAEDFEVAGNKFKKETQVIIRSDSSFLIHCLNNPVVQGYHIEKTNYKNLFFVGSTNFSLYPSGKLRFFQPVDDIEIEGVWCRPSPVRGGVSLYENGRLKECTSAKEQTIQGELVEKNFTLKFNVAGKITYSKKEKIFD